MNSRLLPLFTDIGLKKLQNAVVGIVGVGGVGGEAVVALARSNVGTIIIQDFDNVEESNINRQVVANMETIGLPKVQVMKDIINKINPNIKVVALNSAFSKDNLSIFEYNPHYILDCIDSIDSKCELINYCLNNNIEFISAMGAAKKLDPSKISIQRIDKTIEDPLAKIVRLRFKNKKFMTVSSTEHSNCSELGSYMPVVATFGLYMAHYVITKIVETEKE